ncbi:MAG TPA: polynucleotide adenylyltransferase PcnB [Polyangiaceae bacterium]|jgi:poly(A) polymerase|nr:polynucleotide adenylyltransferase PcnB [Polyangiaceae bacterium]
MVSRSPAKGGVRAPNDTHRDTRRGEPVEPEPGHASRAGEASDPSADEAEPESAPPLRRFGRDGGPEPEQYAVEFEEGRIDPDAAKVVKRLTRAGYEAYLVGGAVRDLLIGRSPKDFDVATSARPDDVRRLFRNSRIIGRRFRLVHVLFGGGKVIETATFRRPPEENQRENEDLLIRNDNVFGEAHQDAYRRDFTINGLFYDLDHNLVLDWVGGMADIERRAVHTIGTPVVRFQEDPVRILRAIKFAAQLDLGVTPEVYDAMVLCRGALRKAARPRLFEEVLRLLRSGASRRAFWLAWETGVLDVLLPELSTYLADLPEDDNSVWRILQEVDRTTQERKSPLDDTVLWAMLLLEPMREACAGEKDRVEAAYAFLEPIVDRLNVPRRIADAVRRIVALMPRVEAGRTGRFARTQLYPALRDVVELRAAALGEREPIEGNELSAAGTSAAAEKPARKRRRRRKPRVEES